MSHAIIDIADATRGDMTITDFERRPPTSAPTADFDGDIGGLAVTTPVDQLISRIAQEEQELEQVVSLTANENIMSRTAAAFVSSPMESRYHLGDDAIGRFLPAATKGAMHYRALPSVFELEAAAKRAIALRLGAVACDCRSLSGVHAMIASLLALTAAGDVVYSLAPEVGGHFASRSLVYRSGRVSRYLPWDAKTFDIDAGALVKEIQTLGTPSMVLLDHGLQLFPYDLARLRDALPPETRVVYDASHPLGLVFGGTFQDPLREGCDVLQGNTHKTFPGPQKALVAFRELATAEMFSNGMNDGLVSSQHTHHALALYVTALEMQKHAHAYAQQIHANAAALAQALLSRGFGLVTRRREATQSHILLMDRCGLNPMDACNRLLEAGISTNARPFLGAAVIRLGVQELTRRGMREPEMVHVAGLMERVLLRSETPDRVRADVKALRGAFPSIHYSFDVR